MNDESLESLVAEGLEILESRGRTSFEEWCDALPAAAEIRGRIRTLGAAGLVEIEDDAPRLDRFEIKERLGSGGMGVVYRALQTSPFVREVALKCPRRDRFHPSQLARFETESQTLASLEHPAIARVYEAGRTKGGQLWFSMELIHGEPLTAWCDRRKRTIEQRLRLFLDLCAGVEDAHRHGILHRDLKPSNVLVTGDDDTPRPKIIDFGLARGLDLPASHPGQSEGGSPPLGTLEYASPEQVAGRPGRIDVRSDVYSLGVLLFELLTGDLPRRPPSERETSREALERYLLESPPRRTDDLPPASLAAAASTRGLASGEALRRRLAGDLERIVQKAVAAERDARYDSVRDLADDVRRFQDGRPVLASPPGVAYRAAKWARRHRVAVSVLALVAVVASLGAASTIHQAIGWRRTLEKLDFVVAADTLEALLHEERSSPPPAIPDGIPALEQWLQRMDRTLAALASLDPAIRELRREADGAPDPEASRLHALETRLLAVHADIVEPEPPTLRDASRVYRPIDFVRRRLARARRLATREPTLDAAAFDAVNRRLREDPQRRFVGLSLAPTPGLVPLGPDPDTGLEEFALDLDGTALPRRDADGLLRPTDTMAPVLVLVPGGTTWLGAQWTNPAAPCFDRHAEAEEGPVRQVTLRPFLVGKFEISSAQWLAMTGESSDTSHFYEDLDDTPAYPRNNVSFVVAQWVVRGFGLALPTEDQWEYAARAGSQTPWFTGDKAETTKDYANVYDRGVVEALAGSQGGPACPRVRFSGTPVPYDDGWIVSAPVFTGLPNDFGLHHTIGNVREICDGPYRRSDTLDDHTRPYRGASWRSDILDGRSSARMSVDLEERSPFGGLRVVMSLPDSAFRPQ